MSRRSVPPALAVALLFSLLAVAPASAATHTFRPLADGAVRADQPRSGGGTATTLRVAADPRGLAYLRFRATGLRGRYVQRAILRLHVTRGSAAGLTVHRANRRGWTERSLIYATRPGVGPALAVAAGGRTLSLDVTPAVRADGTVDLALLPGTATSALLAAREDRKHPPVLVVRSAPDVQPKAPVTAAFYDPRDPFAFGAPDTIRHHPIANPYRAGTPATFRRQLRAFRYGRLQAGVIDWDPTVNASAVPVGNALTTTRRARSRVRWAIRLSLEEAADPTPDEISTVLLALDHRFGHAAAYLRVGGRPVVFVSTATTDTCAAVARWKRGNAIGAYLLFDAFDGAAKCRNRPDAFYADRPARGTAREGRSSFAISPGFYRGADALPKLNRDLPKWARRVRLLRAAKVPWRLVNSFNDWFDGSAVEAATEWWSASHYGTYLDVLHQKGAAPRERRIQNVAAVGDIACDPSNQFFHNGNGFRTKCRQKAVHDVITSWSPLDAFLMLGDGQYEVGQFGAWAASYDKTFGDLRPITYPAAGNHDYLGDLQGTGFFDYWNGPGQFSGPAGDRDKGYYSFDLGAWHVIMLNTNCSKAGGCFPGSRQERWLRSDLRSQPRPCTLAFWHQPLFTSGGEVPGKNAFGIWRDLRTYGADLVLYGHEHDYERFRMQIETGASDPSGGIREIVVGTGGKNLEPFGGPPAPGEIVRNNVTYGALNLKLKERSYTWRFQPIKGKTFRDSGSADCH